MSPSATTSLRRELPAVLMTGILWGAAVAVLEIFLFNRRFHAELQQFSATFELVLNYALYSGVLTVLLLLAAEVLGGGLKRRVQRSGSAPAAGRAIEAAAGAFLLVAVLFNFMRIGSLSAHSYGSPAGLGLAAGAVVAVVFLYWGFYRIGAARPWILRTALLAWIVTGVLWAPLFGKYTGLIRSPGEKAPAGSHKNVLFIMVDTMRRDFLDCYGAQWRASPVSDRLAKDGTVFDNQIAQSSWTLPSTASLLTGRFPSSHGAAAIAHPVSPSAVTMAEVLQQNQFHTGAFVENLYILPRNGFGRGFDRFWAYWLPWLYDGAFLYRITGRLGLPTIEFTEKDAFPLPVTKPDQVNWDARITTDRALDWLRGLDQSPFFAYLHFMGPHGPYGPPEFLLDRERPRVEVADHPRDTGGAYPLGECGTEATKKEIMDMRVLYAADIMYVDHQVSRILDWLEETGKLEETLIVYTSDHGEEFYEHCAWNHGESAFGEVLRVPLLLAAPGLVPAGRRIPDYTRHVDVMPTVIGLLGLESPGNVQGRSLRPLLDGRKLPPLPVYSEIYPASTKDCSIFSLMRDNYKMITVTLRDRSASMLFDLKTDPSELNDLAQARPEPRDSLLDEMLDWNFIASRYGVDADPVPLDERSLQRLKSLGYIQ